MFVWMTTVSANPFFGCCCIYEAVIQHKLKWNRLLQLHLLWWSFGSVFLASPRKLWLVHFLCSLVICGERGYLLSEFPTKESRKQPPAAALILQCCLWAVYWLLSSGLWEALVWQDTGSDVRRSLRPRGPQGTVGCEPLLYKFHANRGVKERPVQPSCQE